MAWYLIGVTASFVLGFFLRWFWFESYKAQSYDFWKQNSMDWRRLADTWRNAAFWAKSDNKTLQTIIDIKSK